MPKMIKLRSKWGLLKNVELQGPLDKRIAHRELAC